MNNLSDRTPMHYLIPGVFLTGILFLSYRVLSDFLITIVSAFIIAYIAWPAYRLLKNTLSGFKASSTISAAIMAILITALVSGAAFWLATMLKNEIQIAYQSLAGNFEPSLRVSVKLEKFPWLQDLLQHWLDQFNADRTQWVQQALDWIKQWLGQFTQLLGGVGSSLVKLGLIPVTLFFCFRDGDEAVKQLHLGLIHFLGKYQHFYLKAVADTTRAVVYGQVLAGMGQGLVAGIGYAVAGVQAPALFGVLTALLALIPMGAMLIWVTIGLALIFTGKMLAGVGLLLWGVFVISTIDNVIRPIVISGAGQVPFLLVMFGIIGGLGAFGPIGLFLGPVILSVLLSVWQAWLKLQYDGMESK